MARALKLSLFALHDFYAVQFLVALLISVDQIASRSPIFGIFSYENCFFRRASFGVFSCSNFSKKTHHEQKRNVFIVLTLSALYTVICFHIVSKHSIHFHSIHSFQNERAFTVQTYTFEARIIEAGILDKVDQNTRTKWNTYVLGNWKAITDRSYLLPKKQASGILNNQELDVEENFEAEVKTVSIKWDTYPTQTSPKDNASPT